MGPRVPSPGAPVVIAVPDGGRIVIHAFPNDARFLRDIRRAFDAVQLAATTEPVMARLQRALRAWYPSVDIRAREDLANLSPSDAVWYVLRDGKIHQPRELIDHMHRALADARETAARSDVAVERARSTLAFAQHPRSAHQAAADDQPPSPARDAEADHVRSR